VGGGLLNMRLWNLAVATGEAVGTCRMCSSEMIPLPTHIAGTITWYSAVCTMKNCERTIASPNGEILRRSGRHSEMPAGWWQGRTGKKSF
jgi:hypothetical protein